MFVRGGDLKGGSGGLEGAETPSVFAAFAINPVTVLDLIAGPLTGSVELLGPEDIGGVATTHYRANFDFDKVMKDTRRRAYTEDARDGLETLLDLLVVKGSIHKGDVWLAPDGRPRRFTIRIRQEPVTEVVIEMIITLDLVEIGAPAPIEVPAPAQLVKVGSVLQYINAGVPAPGTPEFATLFFGATV